MESKCPCCNATLMFLNKGTAECFKCPFTCTQKDLPRIDAAMELARAYVDWDDDGTNKQIAINDVIEVFGGDNG